MESTHLVANVMAVQGSLSCQSRMVVRLQEQRELSETEGNGRTRTPAIMNQVLLSIHRDWLSNARARPTKTHGPNMELSPPRHDSQTGPARFPKGTQAVEYAMPGCAMQRANRRAASQSAIRRGYTMGRLEMGHGARRFPDILGGEN